MSNPVAIGSDRASESAGNEATLPAAGWWLNFVAGSFRWLRDLLS